MSIRPNSAWQRPIIVLGLALAAALTVVAPALADALVVVEVRASGDEIVDGEVVLTGRGPGAQTYRCSTADGACQIDGVRGGMYRARFTPAGGQPGASRTVMIPPDGRVELHLSAD